MYYLMESNCIISDEKIKDYGMKIKNNEIHTSEPYELFSYGKIKRQSENVFDLIEAGDLIKIDNIAYIVLDTTEKAIIVDRIFGDLHLSKGNINMIYKPNKNGDYIKVWERRE